MKHIYTILFFVFPCITFAHATPVEYFPAAFTVVSTSKEPMVRIHFNEPVVEDSAHLSVFLPDDSKLVLKSNVEPHDQHQLFGVLPGWTSGVYTVSWEVVSALDGHFTKGAYSFFVGATSSAPEIYGGQARASALGKKTIADIFPLFFEPKHNLWSASRADASRNILVTDLGEGADALQLRAFDEEGRGIVSGAPLAVLHNKKEGIGPLVVPVKNRGEGKYDIPLALFVPHGEWHIAVTWKHPGAYDINATFGFDYPNELKMARVRAGAPRHMNNVGVLLVVCLLALPPTLLWYNRQHARKHISHTGATDTTTSPKE